MPAVLTVNKCQRKTPSLGAGSLSGQVSGRKATFPSPLNPQADPHAGLGPDCIGFTSLPASPASGTPSAPCAEALRLAGAPRAGS